MMMFHNDELISNTEYKRRKAEIFNNSVKVKTPHYLKVNDGPNRLQRRTIDAIRYKDHASNRSKPYIKPNKLTEEKKANIVNNGIKKIHKLLLG